MLALNLRAAKSICRAAFAGKKCASNLEKTSRPNALSPHDGYNFKQMEIHCSLIFYAFR